MGRNKADELDRVCAEARACGLSYGRYVSMLAKQDELRRLREARARAASEAEGRARDHEAACRNGPCVVVRPAAEDALPVERVVFRAWAAGKSDATIGAEIGKAQTAVFIIRRGLGLPANKGRPPKVAYKLYTRPDGAFYARPVIGGWA